MFFIRRTVVIISLFVILTIPALAQDEGWLPELSYLSENPVPLHRFGMGDFQSVAWSPDGKVLAVGGSAGIWLFDADDLEAAPRHFDSRKNYVSVMAFSPDGTLLATGGDDVLLWDVESGEILEHIPAGEVSTITFSPDGSTLATAVSWVQHREATIRLWSTASGRLQRVVDPRIFANDLQFLPDGESLLVLQVFDCCSATRLFTVGTPEITSSDVGNGDAEKIALSPDGTTLLQVLYDSIIYKIDLATGEISEGYTDGSSGARAMAYLPGSEQFFTLNYEGVLRLWDVETLTVLETYETGYGVQKAAMHPAGEQIAALDGDGVLRLINLTSGEIVWEYRPSTIESSILAFSPDDSLLVTGGAVGEIWVWDMTTGERKAVLEAHEGRVNAIAFNEAGSLLASAGEDSTVRLWDMTDFTARETLVTGDEPFKWISFDPDGTTLFTATETYFEKIDLETGEPTALYTDPATNETLDRVLFKDVPYAVISNGEDVVFSTFMGLFYWDSETNTVMPIYSPGSTVWIDSLALLKGESPYAFVSGGHDNVVRWWSYRRPEQVRSDIRTPHNAWINALAVSAGAQFIASGGCAEIRRTYWDPTSYCFGGDIRLWSRVTLTDAPIIFPPGHSGPVIGLAFNAEVSLLASVSEDGTVILWN